MFLLEGRVKWLNLNGIVALYLKLSVSYEDGTAVRIIIFISRCYVVAMFDITTNELQTVRYQMPGAVAVRYLARYRTAIP